MTIKSETAAAKLQQLLESKKLTNDQRAALEDAIYDVMSDLQIHVLDSPEVAAATLSAAIKDCADADETKKVLSVMRRIQKGDKFKGYLKKQKAEQKEVSSRSAEHHRIKGIREHRSEFFIRVVRSEKRGTLAHFGIAENSVCVFEKHPAEPLKHDDIVLFSTSGNYWDACRVSNYGNLPKVKGVWIIGRLIAHGQLTPVWNPSKDDASGFMQSGVLKIQKATF